MYHTKLSDNIRQVKVSAKPTQNSSDNCIFIFVFDFDVQKDERGENMIFYHNEFEIGSFER